MITQTLIPSTTSISRVAVVALAAMSPGAPAWATHLDARLSMMDKGQTMDDLKPFVTAGSRVLESMKGDLTGSGQSDAVLVVDPPGIPQGKLGEGPARIVLLLVRDDEGHLRQASANARVVPCATCGGVAGDPFGYVKIELGAFTIVNGGGSRQRWSDAYTFTYANDRRDWIVTRVVRKVTDTESGAERHIDLGPRELGAIPFREFDPAKVPDVSLP